MRVKLYALGASALLAAAVEAAGGEPALVPAPRSVVLTGGAYSAAAAPGTLLARDAELLRSAIRFETDAALPAEAGHDVIVSSVDATYFSVPQQLPDDPFTYLSPNRHVTLAEAYRFDPYKGLSETAKPRVIGAECALWSECIWNVFDLDYKAWPRTCAFAEAVWSAPADRNMAAFAARLERHRRRLVAQGVNCAPVEKSGFVAAPAGKDLGPVLTDAEVRTCKKLTGKKAAAFVDDVLWALRDLARTNPGSVWEVPFFKMLKECHDKYGLKIQLNLFYRADFFYGADEFSLAGGCQFTRMGFGDGAPEDIPDFTRGAWKSMKPVAIGPIDLRKMKFREFTAGRQQSV